LFQIERRWQIRVVFGLRWQSAAATALFLEVTGSSACFQSGVALRLPPQFKMSFRQCFFEKTLHHLGKPYHQPATTRLVSRRFN
jgi:hypothetical protein